MGNRISQRGKKNWDKHIQNYFNQENKSEMAKYGSSPKEGKVSIFKPCNHHPETCGCGGGHYDEHIVYCDCAAANPKELDKESYCLNCQKTCHIKSE